MKYAILLCILIGCGEKKECPCLSIQLSDIGNDTTAIKIAKKLIKRHGCGEINFGEIPWTFADGYVSHNLHVHYGHTEFIDTSTVYLMDDPKHSNEVGGGEINPFGTPDDPCPGGSSIHSQPIQSAYEGTDAGSANFAYDTTRSDEIIQILLRRMENNGTEGAEFYKRLADTLKNYSSPK